MVEIEAVLNKDGILKSCRASGHARAGKTGTDIVCAAVSVLLRTAVSTLSERKGIDIKYGKPKEGQLWLEAGFSAEGKDFLFVCGEYLINGLSSVAQEYPKSCKLTIRTED